jgi:predicted alpha/beta-fold hydrolase
MHRLHKCAAMWQRTHGARFRVGLLVLAVLPLPGNAKEVLDYEFPAQSAARSTVLGTPLALVSPLAAPGKIRERNYYLDLNKPGLEAFKRQRRRGSHRLSFSLAYQKTPAPLVVSIAGTGGSHEGGNAQLMKRLLYRAGFHVLSLSSPTHPEFIFAASSTNHAGVSPEDAQDLYNVIQRALEVIGPRIEITDYYLTGYSLGGLNAAFLSQLDDRVGAIGFSKVLLINPPVNLVTSVTNLTEIVSGEEFIERTGSRSLREAFFDPVLQRLSDYYKREGRLDLTGDAMYRIAEGVELSDFDLRVLVRVAFGFSIADMVFVSDVLNHYGFVVPPTQKVFTVQGNNNVFFRRSASWTFMDYFRLMLLPYWQSTHPQATEESVEFEWSLLGMQEYLAGQSKIHIQHNTDDFILGEGDLDFIRSTFGDRALIYPAGGHCGNMNHRRNVDDMLAFFQN